MRQRLLLKSLFLLCALIGGVLGAWAQTDELTASNLAATSTTYENFTNVSVSSSAVYAGNSAKTSTGGIQMRSKNSSGIVSTTSGGKLKSVTITVESGSNTIDVYGSNSAYTGSSDLYGSSKGTKIGYVSSTGTVTVPENTTYEYVGIRSNNGAVYITSISIVWETTGGGDTPLPTPTVTIDATGITNTNVFTGTAAGSLSASVTYNDALVNGATVTWSGNNDDVATINASTGVVTLVGAGNVTFTATYAGNDDYNEATATYNMTVTNIDPNTPGTVSNPYSVAEAIAYINTLGSSTSGNEVYVNGIVSQVDSYNSTYHSITYWISDDGTTTNQMEVYSGKGLDGANFSSVNDLLVGDAVTIKGYVKKYSGTPEFTQNNKIVSLQRPEAPAAPTFSLEEDTYFTPQDVTLTTETEGATIYYSINNSAFSEYTSPITLDPGEYGNTKYTVKAYAKKGFRSSEEVSATYTINREKQIVVAPSTIDLGIEGGSGELAVTYINFPDYQSHNAGFHYWKYNGTNAWKDLDDNIPAWFHIEFSKDRSTLTYTIDENTTSEARNIEVDFWIQNTFSNRLYFKQEAKHFPIQVTPTLVEATAEGESGTIAVTYDENINNDDAAVVFCNAQGEAATYDWITAEINATTKSLDYTIVANTGEARTAYLKVRAKDDQSIDAYSELITITQAAYVAPPVVATITVSPTSVEAPCEGTGGTISVTYNNITNVAADVYFCDSQGEAATYDWITADINSENNVEYIINANTGEARTAYMKVYALDDNDEKVYSEIITITQAVLDYATLPFVYDGNGKGTLPYGFTVYGLDSYNNSPKMQFNSTGDWAILKFNEAPGTLSFDIKGNSFSGGTFKVQTSEDGETYTDLETYTNLSATRSEEFDNLGQNVRYIKWSYTKKNNGNVALGNIQLAKYVAKYTLTYSQPEHGTIIVKNGDIPVNSGDMFEAETSLNITAEAAEGYSFQTWTANAGTFHDNNATTTFTMPAEDVTLSATFTINSHLLTTLTENGILAITVDGVEQTMTSDGIIVNYGQTVRITATPADNYTFNNWESDDLDEFDTAANPLIFTMPDKNIGVIANFIDANKDYDITLKQPKSGATISAKVGGLNVETAKKDDKVVLSYDITGKKAFVSWTVLDDEANEVTVTYDEQNDEYSFTMPASDVEVEAEFVDIYTVDFFVNGTKDSEATYAADAAIIFPEVTAPEGLTFMGWTESVISGTQNTAPAILVTEATMGTADKTYYAVYASRSDIPSAFSEYEKVTTNPGDWSGTYLLGATYNGGSVEANKGTFVFSGFGSNIGNKVALTPGTTEYSDYEIVIAKSGSHYTLFHTSSGKYFSYSGSNNVLNNNSTVNGDNEKWDIDESGVITNVAVSSRKIQYNGSNPRFACYTSVQTPTDLYKRIETVGTVYSDYCTSVPNTISVSVSDAKYATFSNGRAVDFSETGISVYTAKVDGTVVKMSRVVDGIVPANTGVILYSDEVKTNVSVPATACSTTLEDNELVATTQRVKVYKTDGNSHYNYILQKDSESGKVVFNMAKEAGAYMPAGRAYLSTTVDASASNSRLSVMFADDVVTSIAGMNHETSGTANDVYDLQGRKVDTSLMKKGLYIVRSGKNARKVVK